jgi:hypothetical protein
MSQAHPTSLVAASLILLNHLKMYWYHIKDFVGLENNVPYECFPYESNPF